MTSDPVLRMRIEDKVRDSGAIIGSSLSELKSQCDMNGVSNTQFAKALRSLHYKYGRVHVGRPHPANMGFRPYRLSIWRTLGAKATDDETLDVDVLSSVRLIRGVMSHDSANPVEYTDFEFDDKVLGCVSGISKVFGLDPERNRSLRSAVDYLEARKELKVDRVPVRARALGKKTYPAQDRVTIHPM